MACAIPVCLVFNGFHSLCFTLCDMIDGRSNETETGIESAEIFLQDLAEKAEGFQQIDGSARQSIVRESMEGAT
jgi:hypothetical protein